MINRNLILSLMILLMCIPLAAQTNQQDMKREVTLYNPYIPSLPDFKKRSFLPEMNDTSSVRPDFNYSVITSPYTPQYTISTIKAASLLPDPLEKLYKSYLNMGLGNYFTPLAELSITNERSKKGAVGFYAKHFSSNGKVRLDNRDRVFAGYMDNDLSLFGKKFFRNNIIEGSVDFAQKARHAYGYDTSIVNYNPEKKETRLVYNNLGARLSFSSLNLDSADFSYDFGLRYNYFFNARELYQHNAGISGLMSKNWKGFYAGSALEFDYYLPSDYILAGKSKFIAAIAPFVKKSTSQWNFKLGLQLLLDRNLNASQDLHLYPDLAFGFSIVPSYINFFTGLNGRLERNDPLSVVTENPFLVRDGTLFTLPNTDHALVFMAGLKGNSGIGGNYLVSVSYSMINDMLFYTNFIFPDTIFEPQRGNLFIPLVDHVELLRVHGEMTGKITAKVSYSGSLNWYKYTLTGNEYAWNKPDWDAMLGLKYNLRDKILASVDVTALGKRSLTATTYDTLLPSTYDVFTAPVHVNLNLGAEYRYTKILSFWLKFNNLSASRYMEWAYYPTQRFLFMAGFTYSL